MGAPSPLIERIRRQLTPQQAYAHIRKAVSDPAILGVTTLVLKEAQQVWGLK